MLPAPSPQVNKQRKRESESERQGDREGERQRECSGKQTNRQTSNEGILHFCKSLRKFVWPLEIFMAENYSIKVRARINTNNNYYNNNNGGKIAGRCLGGQVAQAFS